MPDAGSIGTYQTAGRYAAGNPWSGAASPLYKTLAYARNLPTWADDYRGLALIPVTGTLSGVVKESGVPVSRWVRLYYRPNGFSVSAVNTASDGVFSFTGLDPGAKYLVVAFDDLNLSPDRNAQVFDLLTPV